MSDNRGRLAESLARRVTLLGDAAVETVETTANDVPGALIDELRRHLLAGDTHYTTRPGIVELRERVAATIAAAGGPRYDAPTEIVITAGEGEAMLATLLGIGAGKDSPVRVVGERHAHAALFAALCVDAIETRDEASSNREVPTIHLTGSSGFGDAGSGWESVETTSIVIGNLDNLAGMDSFRVGYAAGPADILKKVMTWKQAFSICTAAPSQRAAIWALGDAAGRP